jgi:2-(1,2-epoxy-1,2-dihydrophenyl)acetyl-CoA isomerase
MLDDLAESHSPRRQRLHRMDAVVVSVVQGMAAGAGVPLAAAADLVLAAASASARFTLAYTRLASPRTAAARC